MPSGTAAYQKVAGNETMTFIRKQQTPEQEQNPFKTEIISNEKYISEKVLSDKIEFVNSALDFEETEIDETKFKVNVQKIWKSENELIWR